MSRPKIEFQEIAEVTAFPPVGMHGEEATFTVNWDPTPGQVRFEAAGSTKAKRRKDGAVVLKALRSMITVPPEAVAMAEYVIADYVSQRQRPYVVSNHPATGRAYGTDTGVISAITLDGGVFGYAISADDWREKP